MREQEGYRRNVNIVHTQYTKPKKKLMRDEDKERQKKSYRSYNIYTGGGDDCA